MDEQLREKTMRRICTGLLAHVDAGKTTLAESLLYTGGSIRKLGRVDHKDAFLDTHELERARGITIFSKQAEMKIEDMSITLLDTPGHVDFSAEMERTLQVLDYAVLVISGPDGVQGHVQTLWKLLKRYEIPVFLFINKMDQPGTEKTLILEELKKRLDERCIPFDSEKTDEWMEEIALCDEKVMEQYLETGEIEDWTVADMIKERDVFPCYFGSALRMEGIEELLQGMLKYIKCPEYGDSFGARVYKIARDDQGNRLTYLKVTGGSLKVKMLLKQNENRQNQEEPWEERLTRSVFILVRSFALFRRRRPEASAL